MMPKMDPIDEEIRDVFGAFGQAIFLAQKLEGELTNALTDLEFIPTHLGLRGNPAAWERAIDEFFLSCSRKTMGQLLKQLATHQDFYASLKVPLEEALKARNYLSHYFVLEESELGLNSEGRSKLIQKLWAEQAMFRKASLALELMIRPLRNHHIPDQEFHDGFQEYIRKHNSDLLRFD